MDWARAWLLTSPALAFWAFSQDAFDGNGIEVIAGPPE
jgi:hypothetical protein